jgi:hypothetical protein
LPICYLNIYRGREEETGRGSEGVREGGGREGRGWGCICFGFLKKNLPEDQVTPLLYDKLPRHHFNIKRVRPLLKKIAIIRYQSIKLDVLLKF